MIVYPSLSGEDVFVIRLATLLTMYGLPSCLGRVSHTRSEVSRTDGSFGG